MNYLELSIENLQEQNEKLFKKIKEKYSYDLVIFIAKGSFLIGKGLAELKNVPLIEIVATRNGGIIKKILKVFVKLIPNKILIYFRKKEMKSNYHLKNKDRKISYNEDIYIKYKSCQNLLLVDDSIDSGNSIVETKKVLEEYFKGSQIKVAVFNVMSKAIVKPDFYLYEDTMIKGPWSSDSKEISKFLKLYEDWKEEYERKN